MVSSCKQRSHHCYHHNHQHRRRCNRFTNKMHFKYSIALPVVLFVAVFMFSYQYQVLAEETSITVNEEKHLAQITDEKTQVLENSEHETIATHNNKNNSASNELYSESLGDTIGLAVVGFASTTSPNHFDLEQLHSENDVTNNIPPHEDANNNIFLNIDESTRIKISPYSKNLIFTDNLEESIRNSVKTEVELEQNLESSPVLEILKELPEPEIRKTLTADIFSLNQQNLEENDMLLKVNDAMVLSKEEKIELPESIPEIRKVLMESENKTTANSKNLVLKVNKTYNNQSAKEFDSFSDSSSELHSLENTNSGESTDSEFSKDSNASMTSSSESNLSKNPGVVYEENANEILEPEAIENMDQSQGEEKIGAEEFDLTLPETSYELQSVSNSRSSNIAFFNADETVDEALSVVLNETFLDTVQNSGEENLLSFEEKEKVVHELMDECTTVPEEFEHVVIKKVLDVQGIFDDIPVTTVFPFEQEAQKIEVQYKSIDQKNQVEEKVLGVGPLIEKTVDAHQNGELNNENKNNYEIKALHDEKSFVNFNNENDTNHEYHKKLPEKQYNTENAKEEAELQPNDVIHKHVENIENNVHSKIVREFDHDLQPKVVLPYSTIESPDQDTNASEIQPSSESPNYLHFFSTTTTGVDSGVQFDSKVHIVDEIPVKDIDIGKTVKGSRYVSRDMISSQYDDSAATLFEAYLPRDVGQTFNNNLAEESFGIGKALPVSFKNGTNRSTIIIVFSSGTAFLFIVISVSIILISFQRHHGTLDIEMQERSCGKDNLDDEDAETFAKLLEVELNPSVAIALDETEECL